MRYINNKAPILMAILVSISQLIYFASIPFLSRCFSPEDFASFTQVVTWAGFFAVIGVLKFDLIYLKGNYRSFQVQLIIFSVITSVFFSAVFWLVFGTHFQFGEIFVTFVSSGLLYLTNVFFIKDSSFRRIGLLRLSQVSSYSILAIQFSEYSYKALLYSFAISQLLCLIFMVGYIDRRTFRFFFVRTLILYKAILLRARFLLLTCVSSLISLIPNLIPIFVLSVKFDAKYLGLYFMVTQLFSGFFMPIRRSLQNYIISLYANKNNSNGGYRLFTRKYKLLSVLMLVILSAMSIFIYGYGELLFVLFLGDKWVGVGNLVLIAFIYYSLDAFFAPFSQLLNISGHERQYFLVEVIKVSSLVAMSYILVFLLKCDYLTYVVLHFIFIAVFFAYYFFKAMKID